LQKQLGLIIGVVRSVLFQLSFWLNISFARGKIGVANRPNSKQLLLQKIPSRVGRLFIT
jgi:hypothetical protein